ncbi:MAG: hypothetical protein QNJ74_22675 [Trichodesmium sp. MO_231.B1]|nr:hypothetical protein [Trichodesmium sp. MO_231.B1]
MNNATNHKKYKYLLKFDILLWGIWGLINRLLRKIYRLFVKVGNREQGTGNREEIFSKNLQKMILSGNFTTPTYGK